MPQFEFNIIRESTPPQKIRKLQLNALITYLLACSAGLIFAFGTATRAFLQADVKAHDIKRLEQEFKDTHPGQDDINEYASLLTYNVKIMSETIGTIEANLGNRIDLSRILIGISTPLTPESFVTDFQIEHDPRKISFDVAIPITGSTKDIPNAGDLVTLWSGDSILVDHIGKLSAVGSKRKLINGTPYFVLKFKSELEKGTT